MTALVASAGSNDQTFCGAVAIAPRWLLTAAHCINSRSPVAVDAIVGAARINNNQGHRLSVCAFHTPKRWDPETFRGDIALVELCDRHFHPTLRLARPDSTVRLGANVTIAGWGIDAAGLASNQLQTRSLTTRSLAACGATPPQTLTMPARELVCTTTDDGALGACAADSGSPLVSNRPGGPTVTGVVSWSYSQLATGCSAATFHTRVAQFTTWIETTANISTAKSRAGRQCLGRWATHVGTQSTDTIIGTTRGDVIIGLGGADTLVGGRGKDRICAGPGNDAVLGSEGRDALLGGRGADQIRGGPARDVCLGGAGPDKALTCEVIKGIP